MSLLQTFADKMLAEKLDFLPLQESLELFKSGVEVGTTFWWVINIEELGNDDKDAQEMSTEELLESYDEVFGLDNDHGLRVGKEYSEFDEFTLDLCPAPTYIDLLRTIG